MKDFKKLTRRELIECLPQDFKFKKPPWHHQLVSLVQSLSYNGFNFWLDLGLGKSKVAIDAVRFMHQYYKPNVKALIVCLNEAAMGNWAEQVHIHSEMKAVQLLGNYQQKEAAYRSLDNGFYIVNYPGLLVMYSDLKENKKKGGKKRKLNQVKVHAFAEWDVVIFDEAHKLRNPKSLTYKICKRISEYKGVTLRLLLTGTPFVELLDLWGQYYIADGGATFGRTFSSFRNEHFIDVGYFGPKWKPTRKGAEVIRNKMFNRAIRYEESEAKQLPPRVHTKLEYNLGDEQQDYYEKLIKKIPVTLKGTRFEFKSKAIGFREICGGFLMHKLEGSESEVKIFSYNPKLNDLVMPIVESVVNSTKVVIFHDFVVEGRLIEDALRKVKIKFASLRGEISDKYGEYTKFRRDETVRVLVAHPASGGASLEFVEATYCLFYSNVHGKSIDRQQCEKRVHRPGQVNRTFFYDFVARNTIEEAILDDLLSKHRTFKRTIDKESFIKMLRGGK